MCVIYNRGTNSSTTEDHSVDIWPISVQLDDGKRLLFNEVVTFSKAYSVLNDRFASTCFV